jgi:hypothetical protein
MHLIHLTYKRPSSITQYTADCCLFTLIIDWGCGSASGEFYTAITSSGKKVKLQVFEVQFLLHVCCFYNIAKLKNSKLNHCKWGTVCASVFSLRVTATPWPCATSYSAGTLIISPSHRRAYCSPPLLR